MTLMSPMSSSCPAQKTLYPYWTDGTRCKDTTTYAGYLIRRYRPRIEGLFACIERWTDRTSGEIHWRSISKDNITTHYGKVNNSRIFDPPTRTLTIPPASSLG